MKKIAVITGASSGMGRRFAETVKEWGSVDEVWAIARRADRLEDRAYADRRVLLSARRIAHGAGVGQRYFGN